MIVLDVSAATFEEIWKRFELTGQACRFVKIDDYEVIMMGDHERDESAVALRKETDEQVHVYISYEGKLIRSPRKAFSGRSNGFIDDSLNRRNTS